MNEALATLKKYPNVVMATVDDEGKPHTRIMQYLFEIAGKIYFCTNSTKKVSKQLKARPHISIITYSADYTEIARITGEAVFTDDPALKERALDENPGIKDIYKDASNTAFELFYMEQIAVE